MRLLFLAILLSSVLAADANCQTDSLKRYGLCFSGNSVSGTERDGQELIRIEPGRRTSMMLPENGYYTFAKVFQLQFDLTLRDYRNYGYVAVLKDETSGFRLELLYTGDSNSDNVIFDVILNKSKNILKIPVNKSELQFLNWSKVKVSINNSSNNVLIGFNGNSYQSKCELPSDLNLKIKFGTSIEPECPAIALRDVMIHIDGQKRHWYPLDEVTGSLVHDNIGDNHGRQLNGEWMAPQHFGWQTYDIIDIPVRYSAMKVIDSVNASLLYLDKNYAFEYIPGRREYKIITYKNSRPEAISIGVIDYEKKKIRSFFICPGEESTYDLTSGAWTTAGKTPESDWKYFNSALFYNALTGDVYNFGGYGYYKTNNELRKYNPAAKKWSGVNYSGDFIYPRRVKAVGAGPKPGTVWICSGEGNQDGDQRKGFFTIYDLHLLDLTTLTSKKLWNLPVKENNKDPFCEGVMLWSSDYNSFYLLNGETEGWNYSDLRMIELNIKENTKKLIGDFPVIARENEKINDATALLSKNRKVVYLLPSVFEGERTRLVVKRLLLPGYTSEEYEIQKNKYLIKYSGNYYLLVFPVISGIILSLLLYRKGEKYLNKIRKSILKIKGASEFLNQVKSGIPAVLEEKRGNQLFHRICLSGDFVIKNSDGLDISPKITGKARELLLILIIYKYWKNESLPYQKLHEYLWPDIEESKLKNNRGVTLNLLRKSLESIPEAKITAEEGALSISTPPESTVDLQEFLYLYRKMKKEGLTGSERERIITILKRGQLLGKSRYDWIDPFREKYNDKALEILDHLAAETLKAENDGVIELGELYYLFDLCSEKGLVLKIRGYYKEKKPQFAINEFERFRREYQKIYNEPYKKKLETLLNGGGGELME
ncbi:MAG: hypothetical protein HUU54_03570 [Ignavibacteriaceae bacterium]|nr:hypothetical protein [Ignavibacteriaceae bacterium]